MLELIEIGINYRAFGILFPRIATVGAALVALVIALAFIFAGRFLIRAIAFVAVGLAVGSVTAIAGGAIFGIVGFALGGIIGFLFGGLLSFVLLPLAIGIATGLIAYHISQLFIRILPVSLVLGVVFFMIGLFLSLKLLSVASILLGGLLLFDVLIFFHFESLVSLLIAILMGIIGFWVQDGFEGKGRQGYRFSSWSKVPHPFSAVPVVPKSPSNEAVRYCAYCGTRVDNASALFCPNCGANLAS